MAVQFICSVKDCGKPGKTKGYCENHYRRWLRYGDATAGKRSRGEVQSYYRDVVLPYTGDECLIWPFSRYSGGYPMIRRDGKNHVVSRLVCIEENGNPPTIDHQAAHSCGNGHLGCVTKKHMSWKTPKENQADRIEHGTLRFGESHGMAKLCAEDVYSIRSLKGSMSQYAIAKKFGVNSGTINRIFSGKNWASLEQTSSAK